MTKCVISPNKFPIVLFPQKHLGIVLVLKKKLRRLEQNMIFSAF